MVSFQGRPRPERRQTQLSLQLLILSLLLASGVRYFEFYVPALLRYHWMPVGIREVVFTTALAWKVQRMLRRLPGRERPGEFTISPRATPAELRTE